MKNKDFINIDYLKHGNIKQQNSYKVLKELDIFNVLRKFNPILVGTIPINIDIENSDLDIVCEVYDFKEFQKIVEDRYSMFSKFHISNNSTDNETILTVNFYVEDIEIEIYAQSLDSCKQNGYRHMVVEDRILRLGGERTREEVVILKKNGLKTEPAFAKHLGLDGNPYDELLKLEEYSDKKIKDMLDNIRNN
ncbi:DUF4269 domain-containing protein [Clostridium sp. UBA3061]|uniref:DUF4269 domain-containing protein n=1 Tax=Clostridium sp. UBA3061 TaxID=1946353 RepID=UPI003216C862